MKVSRKTPKGCQKASETSMRIDGPLVGAVRTTQKGKFYSEDYHRYHQFKERLRFLASRGGVPRLLHRDDSVKVRIRIYWRLRQRIDVDNITKAVLDGLWANDRRVLAIDVAAEEHTGRERAEVWVEINGEGADENT